MLRFIFDFPIEIACVAIVVGFFLLYRATSSPLFHVQGPFFARFTRLWQFKEVCQSSFPYTNIKLHKKYGTIVRIAPNEYSIDDPAAAKIIYGSGRGYTKSPWYNSSRNPSRTAPSLFTERDPQLHAMVRRKVATAYSMTSLLQSESFVDHCSSVLLQRLSDFAKSGVKIDVCHWMQCYAFDVIGMITFGERFGFLDAGEDVNRVMGSIDLFLSYVTKVGVFPEWHATLFRIFTSMRQFTGFIHIGMFARKCLDRRIEQISSDDADIDPAAPADFIIKFLHIQAADPSKISIDEITDACITNVGAGSDTTGVSLSAIFYYLYQNPHVLAKLRAEIKDEAARGEISDPITYQEAQKMPYLQAVIKESLRLHPATGLILGRVVPKGGAELAGQYFPEGTVVGINSWVAHHNESVFGPDADSFDPERWLRDPEAAKHLDAYFMTFGMGSRTCIGKNISLMEISKIVPLLLSKFDFVPETGKPAWEVSNVWFVKPRRFNCFVRECGTVGR